MSKITVPIIKFNTDGIEVVGHRELPENLPEKEDEPQWVKDLENKNWGKLPPPSMNHPFWN